MHGGGLQGLGCGPRVAFKSDERPGVLGFGHPSGVEFLRQARGGGRVSSLAVQLAVLAELDEPRPTSAVAARLSVVEVDVEEAVSELEAAGLVEREGFGAKTRLVPATPELARAASQVRSSLSAAAWQALFGRERAQQAHVLDRLGRLELAADVVDEPVESLRADAYELVEVGVLVEEEGFRLDPGTPALAKLLAEIDALRAERWVAALDVDGRVRWHLGPEAVFTATGPVDDPEVTYGGPSLFADHGLAVEVDEDVYCRTRRTLDASDAILQATLTHPDDEAVREACLELYAAAATPTFREKARIYGVEAEAEAIREQAERR